MGKGKFMATQLDLDTVCACSESVVARTIEDEIVIIPLVAGIGDEEDELYTLNETGQAIWQKIDGQRTLREVAALLAETFEGSLSELEADVLGFASELTRRGILVQKV
jgi:hypothetical protein